MEVYMDSKTKGAPRGTTPVYKADWTAGFSTPCRAGGEGETLETLDISRDVQGGWTHQTHWDAGFAVGKVQVKIMHGRGGAQGAAKGSLDQLSRLLGPGAGRGRQESNGKTGFD